MTIRVHVTAASISPYSVRMLENADQNNSEYGHFSRSACFTIFPFFYFYFFIFIFIFYYFGYHIVPLIIRFSQTANSSDPILQFQINLTFKSTELPVLTKPPSNPYSQFSCLQHEPKSLSRTLREKCPNTEFFLVRIAERYSASLFIQSECGKIRTRKTPYLETFHAVVLLT